MTITWLGHACFKFQAKLGGQDVTVVTDPFDPKVGIRMPKVQADIVTVSHDHYDHNNLAAIKGEPARNASHSDAGGPFIIESPGEYEVKKVFVQGIPAHHDAKEGAERGSSIIYKFEIEGIKIAHLGDLGTILNDNQDALLDNVDILLVPVGGDVTIGAKQAVEVISQVEPRLVIPMHYKIPGLKVKLDGVDNFLKEMGAKNVEKLDKLRVQKKDLPSEETKVVLLSC